jgi:allantoin racemase
VSSEIELKIANLVTPGAEYQVPPNSYIAADASIVNILTRVEVRLANDPLRMAMRDLVYVEAALRAVEAGCDAIFVNTVGDFGVEMMRHAVSVPVVGAGEASYELASRNDEPFGLVTVWPSSTRGSYERILRRLGLLEQCTSIHFVLEETEIGSLGGGVGVMAAADDPGSAVAERVLASCRAAVQDGAKSVVLGCTCMAGLAQFLQQNMDVEVINPLVVGYLKAEAEGRASSPGPAEIATQESIQRVQAAVQAWEAMGRYAPDVWEDDCGDTCAVLSSFPESQLAVS